MFKRLFVLCIIGVLTFLMTHSGKAQSKALDYLHTDKYYSVRNKVLPAFSSPDSDVNESFLLYQKMNILTKDVVEKDEELWFQLKDSNHWIPAREKNGTWNLALNLKSDEPKIIDVYDILKMPHTHAVKLVKYPGAKGRLETYKKIGHDYELQHTYSVSYPKEGPKSKYGDLKTIGGPVVRYLYRTTRSSMNGWNKDGEHFGVYKVSYPMPHDGLPLLMSGRMTVGQYNKLPTINYKGPDDNKQLYPHPHSVLGADILIHTEKWGSLGCLLVENEAMSSLYHEDLPTEKDKEIIPLVVYDEDVIAPGIGELF